MRSVFYKLCGNKGESFGAELKEKVGKCPHRYECLKEGFYQMIHLLRTAVSRICCAPNFGENRKYMKKIQ